VTADHVTGGGDAGAEERGQVRRGHEVGGHGGVEQDDAAAVGGYALGRGVLRYGRP
jgi:hypothetical protein